MKGPLYKLFFALSLLFLQQKISAQEASVSAVIDSTKIRIGEQVKVDIYLNYDANQNKLNVRWPEIGDTLTSYVEVISVSAIDTTIPDKNNPSNLLQHQQIVVSVYDSGFFAIPGFKFIINQDTAHPRFTNPLFLEVHTVPTDTSASKLKDIKPPLLETFNWKWYLEEIIWTGVIFLLIGVAILIWYFRSLRHKETEPEPEKPKVPAHILALQNLERIQNEQIWKEGKIKEYYSEISDTVRQYIEDRYGLPALESTTDEIMHAFRSQVIDPESKEKLQHLLRLSDLVKFAKLFPEEHEHNLSLKEAFEFVNGTKREDEISLPQSNEFSNKET
ncbi:MAG: hypothetical protein MUF75_00050 [Bacteroidia bacterium]|jgi:hypothetical protein|nr:hypothetical protein [Bacteroidia bacterium]